jgi:branched-chain amino acid transport system substrate-binding protein
MGMKIGLLLTRSVMYPSMAFDLAGGLRGGLADGGMADADIKTESIGLAADDKAIYAACEKLLFDGVGIVAGYMNPASAEKLQPLFEGANAVLLALDAGYHFPLSTRKLPNVFYISLQGALCARCAVTGAVNAGNRKMAYTGSFYDAGYRSPYAFHRALEDTGGEVTLNHITALKKADFSLEPLLAHLHASPDVAVFTSFCGDMLQDFFAAAVAGHVLDGHVVCGASFMGDETWLAKSIYPGVDVQVCVPWGTGLESSTNKKFMSVMKDKRTGVNLFSLLGWEAGQVAAAAMHSGDYNTLEGLEIDSPRGTVTLTAGTHQCHAPVYNATVKKDEANGNCRLEINEENPYANTQRKALQHDIETISGSVTSWYNAYGCLDS